MRSNFAYLVLAFTLIAGISAPAMAQGQNKPVKNSDNLLRDTRPVMPEESSAAPAPAPAATTTAATPAPAVSTMDEGAASSTDAMPQQNGYTYATPNKYSTPPSEDAIAAPQANYTYATPEKVSSAAMEDEPVSASPWTVSGDVNVTSDYVFRGYSQTDENPAIQGSITVAHENGLSATVWGSNVDFDDGDQAHVELDGIVAWDFDLGPGTMSLGGAYYFYPGADSNLDYNYGELFAAYTHPLFTDDLSLEWSFYYAPEYFANSGDAEYVGLAPSFALFGDSGLSLNASGGYQWIEENLALGTPDYWNWSAGLSYTWDDQLTLGVNYYDTDVDRTDCADLCNPRVVVNLDYAM